MKLLWKHLGYPLVNNQTQFESLFAVGVDEMSWDDLFEDNYDWPVWREAEAVRGKDGEWRDAKG